MHLLLLLQKKNGKQPFHLFDKMEIQFRDAFKKEKHVKMSMYFYNVVQIHKEMNYKIKFYWKFQCVSLFLNESFPYKH